MKEQRRAGFPEREPQPENKFRQFELEIGGMSADEVIATLRKVGVPEEEYGTQNFLLQEIKKNEYRDPTTFRKERESLDLIRIKVRELFGDVQADEQLSWQEVEKRKHDLHEIYQRARELGFELCPAAVGPYLRLKLVDQPKGEQLFIGMHPVNVYGANDIFSVENGRKNWDSDDYALKLRSAWADKEPYYPESEFVFRAPKKEETTETI